MNLVEKILVHINDRERVGGSSVTRLDFGQVFKAFGNIQFVQISYIPGQIL